MSFTTTLLLALLAAETIALVVLVVLYRREKKKPRLRRVEAPNSEFQSPYVQDLESQDRWEGVDLSRLHDVNREEFEKLLEKVRDDGVRSLSKVEREFLDRMAGAADRSPSGEPSTRRQGPPRQVSGGAGDVLSASPR